MGAILAAAPRNANAHGRLGSRIPRHRGEQVQLLLDLDAVLERLGLLARDVPAIDPARTFAYGYRSPDYRTTKLVRFSPGGREPEPSALAPARLRLERELERVTFEGGVRALRSRPPRAAEARRGAHATVEVEVASASARLYVDGRPLAGAVRHLGRISGSHGPHTRGIFLAAGSALDPGATPTGISIFDITPTLLYALGLPVGADLPGRARLELFTSAYRRGLPLRTIPSWGERAAGEAPVTADDRRLLEELAGLGYLK